MSTNYEFKKIGDVDVIESVSDSAHVIIEDSGILKKMVAKSIGAVKTVNGASPDKDGNVQIQAGVQPDWNQNDDAAVDFVKNRTHYDVGENVEIELIPSLDFEFGVQEGMGITDVEIPFAFEPGCQYAITIDGEKYVETATVTDIFVDKSITLGESFIKVMMKIEAGASVEFTKPFIIIDNGGSMVVYMLKSEATTHNISVSKIEVYEHKVMYDKTGVEFALSDSGWSSMLDMDVLVPGVEYTIVYDGATYICESVSEMDGMLIIIVPEDESFMVQNIYGMNAFIDNTTPVEGQKVVNISIDKTLEDGTTEELVAAADYTLELSKTGPSTFVHSCTASADGPFEVGTTYSIECNGEEYVLVCYDVNGTPTLGNMAINDESYENTGEPFVFGYTEGSGVKYMFKYDVPEVTHDIKITGYTKNIKKLDKKYLPADYVEKTEFDALAEEVAALTSSVVTVHSGTSEPTSDVGTDGDVYLVTEA